ncbi:MAG: hypothetical protein R3B84_00615 [Zavarzinella sp.]
MRRYRAILMSMALCGVPTLALAQSPLLKQQERIQQIAVQRIETELSTCQRDVSTLVRAGRTGAALERIRQAQGLLRDPVLPDDKVRLWQLQLDQLAANVKVGTVPAVNPTVPGKPGGGTTQPVVTAAEKRAALEQLKQSETEFADVLRSMDTIQALVKAGANAQATKEFDFLKGKYPNNPTVLTLEGFLTRTRTIEEVKQIHAQQAANLRKAYEDLQVASTPPKSVIEFDKEYFKEITELRKPKISEGMKKIIVGLKTPTSIQEKNIPLKTFLKSVEQQIKQPIIIDQQSLADSMLDDSSAITLDMPRGTVRTALRLALAQHGLTYIVKDETIVVMTRDKAARTMETRVYYMGDVLAGGANFPGFRGSGFVHPLQAQQNAELLIKQIKDTIDPASWAGGGSDGKGDIVYHAASMSIIVRASAEVHGMIFQGLGK